MVQVGGVKIKEIRHFYQCARWNRGYGWRKGHVLGRSRDEMIEILKKDDNNLLVRFWDIMILVAEIDGRLVEFFSKPGNEEFVCLRKGLQLYTAKKFLSRFNHQGQRGIRDLVRKIERETRGGHKGLKVLWFGPDKLAIDIRPEDYLSQARLANIM